MGRHRVMREKYDLQHLRVFPKENLILTYYILSAWGLHLLDGLEHHFVWSGLIKQVMVMTNNLTILGYKISKCSLKNPPNIVYTLTHTCQIVTWNPSRLSWALDLWGRDQSINCFRPCTTFTSTNNQDGPSTFDTSMRFSLWDPGCNKSINPYF